ncbi:MAG: hypothetical protein ACHQ7M_03560 [Chloroflexota bacterium]
MSCKPPQGHLVYVDPGIGGVQFEFVGSVRSPNLAAWLKDDFATIVISQPPWEA